MIKGRTSSGFNFNVDETALDDMRLVDTMAVLLDPESNNSELLAATAKAAEMILGKGQKEALYEHIAKEHNGRVPRAVFDRELSEIMSSGGKDAEKN